MELSIENGLGVEIGHKRPAKQILRVGGDSLYHGKKSVTLSLSETGRPNSQDL